MEKKPEVKRDLLMSDRRLKPAATQNHRYKRATKLSRVWRPASAGRI